MRQVERSPTGPLRLRPRVSPVTPRGAIRSNFEPIRASTKGRCAQYSVQAHCRRTPVNWDPLPAKCSGADKGYLPRRQGTRPYSGYGRYRSRRDTANRPTHSVSAARTTEQGVAGSRTVVHGHVRDLGRWTGQTSNGAIHPAHDLLKHRSPRIDQQHPGQPMTPAWFDSVVVDIRPWVVGLWLENCVVVARQQGGAVLEDRDNVRVVRLGQRERTGFAGQVHPATQNKR